MIKISEQIKNALIAIALGFFSAILGTFIFLSLFLPSGFFTQLESFGTDQNQEFLKTSLGVKAYGRLEVFEFLDKALPSTATIYKKKIGGTQLLDRLYIDKDRLGLGFTLTSDGWIVSHQDVLRGLEAKKIAVFIKDKIYDAEIILEDTWTDIVFIKIEAQGLPVVVLGDSNTLKLGDIIFTGTDKNNFWFSYLKAVNFYPAKNTKEELILSSDGFGKFLKPRDALPSELDGGMVAGRNGEVLGIILADKNYILPINYFKNIIPAVLKNKKISRPHLGLNYVDLNYIRGESLIRERGAYVYGGGIMRSVIPGSPAYRAGLVTGDLVLKVNDEDLSKQKNLGEIISQYQPGDKITLKVLREGREREVSVILEEK